MLKNKVKDYLFDDKSFCLVAGPCSIESKEQFYEIASELVSKNQVKIIRGGTYKLRTRPGDFQGLGKEAIEILHDVCHELGVWSLSEITDIRDLAAFEKNIDVLMVGTRNMYNYPLLKAIGETQKPVILKRSFSATIDEWLNAALYIKNGGNNNIILCERGIRSFDMSNRFILDLNSLIRIKKTTDYHVFVDPSHASGDRELVGPLTLAAKAAGANGAIIEVHNHPENALSDGFQSLRFEDFSELNKKLKEIK
jgi:3-deoxy-7-phosphoheptulonate synthase